MRWDGEDWEFKWSGGRLYWDSPVARPKVVTEQNMGLFLAAYQPKLGDTILDVGAGAGTEVGQFSRMVGPAGRVIAIEADPAAARRLRKQVSGLEYRNVDVLELAVGEEEGTVHLHIAEEGGVENSTKAVVGASSVAVSCHRLDSLLDSMDVDRISYMKMNIEGAEYEALLGLGSAISKVAELCVSCHDFTGDPAQATFDNVKGYLESSGLRVTALPENPAAVWESYYLFARH
ncbi:MAG: FkbM family methyltransferase [Mycobacterium sp.]|nr:FkbM family methyltransferase [Mycobacterium sp.]